jgi:hypothetical protein
MKFAIVTLSLVAAAVVAGCSTSSMNDPAGASNSAGTTSPGGETTIAYRGSANIVAANLHLSFDSVSSDSRCPPKLQCVWSGSVIVKLSASQISQMGQVQPVTLSTEPGKDTVTVYGQALKLLRVDPARTSAMPVPEASYRVVVRAGGG